MEEFFANSLAKRKIREREREREGSLLFFVLV
jgi:hypothetical protein